MLAWTALFVLSLLMQYASFAAPASVLAVHNEGLFELDGDATNGGAAGDDWDSAPGAFRSIFVADLVDDQNDDTFTGGSSKDDLNIDEWLWKNAKASQAKNDITHAFAKAYARDGEMFAYFGLSKYEADGNNFVGFWFLKSGVSTTGDGNPPGSPFSGTHSVGDILVLANYTNGGAVADFDVYKWVGSGGDANGTLQTVLLSVDCASVAANDDACGKSNAANESSPWTYQGRDSNGNPIAPNTFPPGTFFEGGLNLSALGLADGCFSTFIAETRSSQSVDATLSDFAMGQFSFCEPPTIATQVKQAGQNVSEIDLGESVVDVATLSGNMGTVAGTIEFFVCGPSGSAPDCSTGGDKVGATKTLSGGSATSDAFTPGEPGAYCFRAVYSPASGSKYLATSHTNQTSECVTVVADYQIAIEKTGSATSLGVGGGSVTYTYAVTNPGNAPLTGVTLTDKITGTNTDACSPLGSPSGDADGDGKLDITETWTWTCTTNITVDTDNTATADSNETGPVSDTWSVTVTPPTFGIAIDKTGSTTSLPAGGGMVTYTYKVTNTGNAPLTGVTLTDKITGSNIDACAPLGSPTGDTDGDGQLDLTETWTWTCTTNVFVNTNNTATADSNETGPVADTWNVTVAASEFGIAIDKTGSTTSLPVGGGSVTYTYVVTNTGNVALTGVTLTDKITGTDTNACAPLGSPTGDTDGDGQLDTTETWTWTCTTNITVNTNNTATADSNETGPVSDTWNVTVVATQFAIAIDKTGSTTSVPAGGGSVVYTYKVTNTGNAPLTGVTLTDKITGTDTNACAPLGSPIGDTDGDGQLDLTETWTWTCTTTITVNTNNTATADSNETGPVTDTWNVTVAQTPPVIPPPVLTPGLGITKGVSLAQAGPFTELVNTQEGATVWYQIVVTNTGQVTLSGLTLNDALVNDGSPVAGVGLPASCSVPASLSVGASFTCTYARIADEGVTVNTATADSNETGPANDSATVSAGGVLAATATPQITPPPTDTALVAPTGSNPGFALMLTLLALAALALGLGAFTPVPEQVRRQRR